MATKGATAGECYSCGAEADPKSERHFCTKCDAVFEEGLNRQAEVEDRADRLEQAKLDGDADEVGKIMTGIFKESVVL